MMAPPPEQGHLVRNRAGRLIEARVFGLRTREEVDAFGRDIGIQIMRIPRDVRPILCADHRPVAVYAPLVADRLAELFTQLNARIERVAVLLARSNAAFGAQLQQIARTATGGAARRVVHDADDAHAHLAPVLVPDELASMREFLGEYLDRSPSSQWRLS